MEANYLIKGLLMGLIMTLAIGPIAILCIQRSLTKGIISGLISGLGAVLADLVYVVAVLLGLTLVFSFLIEKQIYLQIAIIIFLIYFGLDIIKKSHKSRPVKFGIKGLFGDFFSTFTLTVLNPMTGFSFVAIFVGFGLAKTKLSLEQASDLACGFFIGSYLVYFLLSLAAGIFGKRMKSDIIPRVNIVSGLLIIGFAVFMLIYLILGL